MGKYKRALTVDSTHREWEREAFEFVVQPGYSFAGVVFEMVEGVLAVLLTATC